MWVKWQTHALFTRAVVKSDLARIWCVLPPSQKHYMVLIPFLLRLCPPRVGTWAKVELDPLCPAVCHSTSRRLCRYVPLSLQPRQAKVASEQGPTCWHCSREQSSPQVIFSVVPSVSLLISQSLFSSVPTLRIFYVWVWMGVFSFHGRRGKCYIALKRNYLGKRSFQKRRLFHHRFLKAW